MTTATTPLTRRWTAMRPHPEQLRWWYSPRRFHTVPAGRRSGKTELAKRKLVRRALRGTLFDNARFFAGTPTYAQSKRVFWEDLKALSPPEFLEGKPSESELVIRYINGSEIHVVGLDKPERIEGSPWDGGILDEFANMKANAWGANVRPALSDRQGWCDLIGVPEGRNHYYDLDSIARSGELADWDSFTWVSADILPPEEIEAARRELDDLTFQQEYEASFVNFSGRAYYAFDERSHCAKIAQLYNDKAPLSFCFDFNVEPGVAAVTQEGAIGTLVIGEVYIPRNSTTVSVCNKLIADWGNHKGMVRCYGDATGGSRGSAKTEGSDWDLIQKVLRPKFGGRLEFRVKSSNPTERARVNSVNSRLRAVSGDIRMFVDPAKAPHVVKDFEGVPLLEGGSGEIDKKKSPHLSHMSDAVGYYVDFEFPIANKAMQHVRIGGA